MPNIFVGENKHFGKITADDVRRMWKGKPPPRYVCNLSIRQD